MLLESGQLTAGLVASWGRWALAGQTDQPTQTPTDPTSQLDTSNTAITAGLGGFFVLFGLGLVLWFIGRDLSKRIRRMNRTEELRREQVGPPAEHSVSGDGAAAEDRAAREDPERGRDPLA